MAEPSATDVSAGVLTRWAAFTALNGVAPAANVNLSRVTERTGWPRARLLVEDGSRELTSGTLVLCKFAVTVDVFTVERAEEIAGLVRQLMHWHNGMTGTGWTLPNGAMISVRPQPGGFIRPTGERITADDVVQVSSKWEALVEGRRELNSF